MYDVKTKTMTYGYALQGYLNNKQFGKKVNKSCVQVQHIALTHTSTSIL